MTDTTDVSDSADSAERLALLRDVLRLQEEHTRPEVEWRSALAAEDTGRVEDLNRQLLALTARVEELTTGIDLGEEPPAVDRRAITSV